MVASSEVSIDEIKAKLWNDNILNKELSWEELFTSFMLVLDSICFRKYQTRLISNAEFPVNINFTFPGDSDGVLSILEGWGVDYSSAIREPYVCFHLEEVEMMSKGIYDRLVEIDPYRIDDENVHLKMDPNFGRHSTNLISDVNITDNPSSLIVQDFEIEYIPMVIVRLDLIWGNNIYFEDGTLNSKRVDRDQIIRDMMMTVDRIVQYIQTTVQS